VKLLPAREAVPGLIVYGYGTPRRRCERLRLAAKARHNTPKVIQDVEQTPGAVLIRYVGVAMRVRHDIRNGWLVIPCKGRETGSP
jgi:hypothetical protein